MSTVASIDPYLSLLIFGPPLDAIILSFFVQLMIFLLAVFALSILCNVQ